MSGEVSSEISQRMFGGLDAALRAGDLLERLRTRGVGLVIVEVVSVSQPDSSAAVP